jgi:uncharacterized protein YecE (DUF72 family)
MATLSTQMFRNFPHAIQSAVMELWIGTSGFQYPEWKGKFYPDKMPAAKMLAYYSERFGTTEINYSFRQIPSEKSIQNWKGSTPDRFRFSFKAPQKITHFARLRDCGDTVRFFQSVISSLGKKQGGVLFQLPPGFKKDVPQLRDFLAEVPKEMRATCEFRDPSWFTDETYDALRESNAALCLAENEELATPFIPTANFGYLRLRRLDYTAADLKERAKFIHAQSKLWRDAFIYFKHEETCVGPKFANELMKVWGS